METLVSREVKEIAANRGSGLTESTADGRPSESIISCRQDLDDTEFVFGWAEATLPKFQPLFAPIELLRKRDAKVFYAERQTGTAK